MIAQSPDRSGDGVVRILVLGSSRSMGGAATTFSPEAIAAELGRILEGDDGTERVEVTAHDLYASKDVTLGLGQNGAQVTYTHHRHSLAQFYYWPEDQQARWRMLSGGDDQVWDYVVISPDPYVMAQLPGYHALGAHKVAAAVVSSGGQPLLLTGWARGNETEAAVDQMESIAHRVALGAATSLEVVPAGRAWHALGDRQQPGAGSDHPSPQGAYLAAAAIYAKITRRSAAESGYTFDDEAAEVAYEVVAAAEPTAQEGVAVPLTPFRGCGVDEQVISYHHTGSSSERGILGGLNWVFDQAPQTLQNGGEAPINFNFGRANSNFEPNKRYRVDPSQFGFSFGFPMQDNGNFGDESMRYGLDHRDSGTLNDTDLGVARFMIEQSELPHARAVPIRTLYAQLREAIPGQSAYRDAWHMHRDLDKAVGGYLYTLLTGQCALGQEPGERDSAAWRSWRAHQIGYQTAWTLMTLEAAPSCP